MKKQSEAVQLPERLRTIKETSAFLGVPGANVSAVQLMLGNASAAMTLDVYAGLFGDDLDTVADRLDEAAALASADYLRTAALERGCPALRPGGSEVPPDLH